MPRIRKLQPGGPSRKLGECFKLLQSGASGECIAGELGCCGDSCCSSALVSRALAEYCQHSDAAREAFVAARGIDALQAALVRGSPSAAVAAARVLGGLCASPHGLRCVLRWQISAAAGGGDLMSTLAAVAGGRDAAVTAAAATAGGPEEERGEAEEQRGSRGAQGLPPELRTECVDALRCALGALHGPAAGGGLELAAALQVRAAGPISAFPGDFVARVALPPLLSPNAHLRAAAARLIAAAAEEGLLAGGGGGGECDSGSATAAATLSAALGLDGVLSSGGGGCNGGVASDPQSCEGSSCRRGGEPAGGAGARGTADEAHESGIGAGCDRRGRLIGPPCGLQVVALCELVAALRDSQPEGAALLQAMRGPSLVLALALDRAAAAVTAGSDGGWCCGGEERPDGGSSDLAEREALLDAVLLCVRQGPDKLWATPGEECARERRGFAAGAARLAALLLIGAAADGENDDDPAGTVTAADAAFPAAVGGGSGGGDGVGGDRAQRLARRRTTPPSCIGDISTAGSLACALASWPQEVLCREELRGPLADLLSGLSGAVASTLECSCGGGAAAEPAGRMQLPSAWQPSASAVDGSELRDSSWRSATPRAPHVGSSNSLDESTTLRAVAAASAAAVRLYGATFGRSATSAPVAFSAADAASAGGSASVYLQYKHNRCGPGFEAAAVVQCLGRLLQVAYDCRTAAALLAAPLEALQALPDEPLEALLEASTEVPGCGSTDTRGFSLAGLACAAAKLVEGLLTAPRGGSAAPPDTVGSFGGHSSWAWRAGSDICAGGESGGGATWGFPGRPSRPLRCGLSGSGRGHGLEWSAEQDAALLAALRLWSRLMARRPSCKCGGSRTDDAAALEAAGTARALADLAGCEACAVRPPGPLEAIAEAVEGLLTLQPDAPLGSADQDWQGPSSHGRFAGSEVFRDGCDGLEDRSTQLLHSLACTLEAAAVCGDARVAAHDPSCTPGTWDRSHARATRLVERVIHSHTTRSAAAAASPSDDPSDQGMDDAGDAATTFDPRDADRAADLADAEAILDECLACIGAGIAVS